VTFTTAVPRGWAFAFAGDDAVEYIRAALTLSEVDRKSPVDFETAIDCETTPARRATADPELLLVSASLAALLPKMFGADDRFTKNDPSSCSKFNPDMVELTVTLSAPSIRSTIVLVTVTEESGRKVTVCETDHSPSLATPQGAEVSRKALMVTVIAGEDVATEATSASADPVYGRKVMVFRSPAVFETADAEMIFDVDPAFILSAWSAVGV
jgi:hypothetical protein